MSATVAVLLAVGLLVGNAFFVGAEFALVSARRTQIEPRASRGGAARLTLRAMSDVSLMMAGAQTGITVCSLGLGAVGEPAVAHVVEGPLEALQVPGALLHPVAFVIAMSVVVYLHMVLGEMVPKNIVLAGPERSALLLGPPLYLLVRALRPFIFAVNWVANQLLLRLVKVQATDEVEAAFSAEQVAGLVEESRREGLLDEHEHRVASGAFTLTMHGVRDVLIPWEQMQVVRADDPVGAVLDRCVRTGFSRFPVHDDDASSPPVYVHVKDLLGLAETGSIGASEVLRALPDVPVDADLGATLTAMQRDGAHLSRVVEPGRDSPGVVALEDVLEELVGEVADAAQGDASRRDPTPDRQ